MVTKNRCYPEAGWQPGRLEDLRGDSRVAKSWNRRASFSLALATP